MWHSEINNRPDQPMRFIQMWFVPWKEGLDPAVQQRAVERGQRTNRLLPLVSNAHASQGALPIAADAKVFASFLQAGQTVQYPLADGHGAYVYLVEGGPVAVEGHEVPTLGAAVIAGEPAVHILASVDAELLLIDVQLT
jgi:hypothetical protein